MLYFVTMKILIFLPLVLLAWYLIDRIGLWLHKLNAGKHDVDRDGLEQSFQNLKYALSAVGHIQSALRACRGDGTIPGLGNALKEYINATMILGVDSNSCALILGINHGSDDAMVASTIGNELRRNALTPDLVAEMKHRMDMESSDYAKCAWSLAIRLCELNNGPKSPRRSLLVLLLVRAGFASV